MRKWYTHGTMRMLVVPLLLFSMTGCGTIFSGTTQTVYFDSVPKGAAVSIVDEEGEEVYTGTTPTEYEMPRRPFHVVTVTKEGYQTTEYALRGEFNQTAMWGNSAWVILFPIGLVPYAIGMSVDRSSGAIWAFDEGEVKVDLTPCKPGQKPHVVLAN